MEITGSCWHPNNKNLLATSSLDGTARIWDLMGEAHFGNLMNKVVLKLRSPSGTAGRIGATAVCYSPDG